MGKDIERVTIGSCFQPLKGAADGCQRRSRWTTAATTFSPLNRGERDAGPHGWRSTFALLPILFLSACAATNPLPIDPVPYAGPDLRIEQGERTHVAVFTMPAGGWGLKFDRVRERFDAHQVFVTLRRPGPTEITSQALVEQSVDTRVRVSHNVEVYARIAEKDQPGTGYRRAGQAPSR
jgi:hypothetical protein